MGPKSELIVLHSYGFTLSLSRRRMPSELDSLDSDYGATIALRRDNCRFLPSSSLVILGLRDGLCFLRSICPCRLARCKSVGNMVLMVVLWMNDDGRAKRSKRK